MDWISLGIAMAAVVLCTLASSQVVPGLAQWMRKLARLARRSPLDYAAVGVLAFGLGAAITLTTRWPQPEIHDEYSYLLAADTFAHGRLTNPTPPEWQHFESFHIILEPTYASKYPPAQGLILAAGQVLTGHAIVGAWLANALACMAVYWMLRARLPGRWALLGGLLSGMHPLLLEWGQCFWGGAAAMLGGALVGGAWLRITRSIRVKEGVAMGLGLILLANSRPFEGCTFSLLVAVALTVWFLRMKPQPWGPVIVRLAIPVGVILAVGAAWMAYYNSRVTGSAHKMPYSVHEAAYSMTPVFLWQPLRPEPEYHHKAIRDFWTGWALDFYKRERTPVGFVRACAQKVYKVMGPFSWKFVLFLPLLAVPFAWKRDHKLRACTLLVAAFTGIMFVVVWPLQPHYAAPLFGVFLLLTLQSMRRLMRWQWQGRAVGAAVCAGLLVGCVASVANFWRGHTKGSEGNFVRAGMIEQLKAEGGEHLIMVRYSEDHYPHTEWVYNDADLPNAPVVWARDMGSEKNRTLFEQFPRRTLWLLEPDKKPAELVPFPPE